MLTISGIKLYCHFYPVLGVVGLEPLILGSLTDYSINSANAAEHGTHETFCHFHPVLVVVGLVSLILGSLVNCTIKCANAANHDISTTLLPFSSSVSIDWT
jgi:hypothetical protein